MVDAKSENLTANDFIQVVKANKITALNLIKNNDAEQCRLAELFRKSPHLLAELFNTDEVIAFSLVKISLIEFTIRTTLGNSMVLKNLQIATVLINLIIEYYTETPAPQPIVAVEPLPRLTTLRIDDWHPLPIQQNSEIPGRLTISSSVSPSTSPGSFWFNSSDAKREHSQIERTNARLQASNGAYLSLTNNDDEDASEQQSCCGCRIC